MLPSLFPLNSMEKKSPVWFDSIMSDRKKFGAIML